jgi:hypothetical protein
MDTWSIRKKQSQTNPNKAKLKKAEMNVTSIITVGYENKPPIPAPKKQSQISKRQKPMQTSLPKGIMKNTALSASGKTNPNKANSKPITPLRVWSCLLNLRPCNNRCFVVRLGAWFNLFLLQFILRGN